jgi:hypothetical protein
MKLFIQTFTIALLLLISPLTAVAATSPTPTPAKTIPSDSLTKEITNLKDKIASRVAELKLVEKRGIVGIVSDVKDTQITLTDIKGDTRFIDVDELTKFSGLDSKSTFGISDIKKGMSLAILGRYNKQSERLLARFVDETTMPRFVSGTINTINSTDFLLVIKDGKGKTFTIDVENSTKTQTYTKENGLKKIGFSKLATGNIVVVNGYDDTKDSTKIVATRILVLSDFSPSPSTNPSPTTAK